MKQLIASLVKNPQFLISLFGFLMLHFAIASITYIYSMKSEALYYSQAFRQLTSITDLRHHKLEIFFSYRISDIRALASSETILNLATTLYRLDETHYQRQHDPDTADAVRYEDAVSVHQKYQHYLGNFLKEYRYTNAYLIDASHGDIMFSTDKHLPVGMNIASSTMSDSYLTRLWKGTLQTSTTQISDIHLDSRYSEAPIMFLATPVRIELESIAILLLQLPGDTINEIMHFRSGMGLSGESYAVGKDHLMRSDSYLKPDRFSVLNSFRRPDTNTADTQAVIKAIAGESGTGIIKDYRGITVLSAYRPFKSNNFTWAIISEIDESEIEGDIAATQKNIVLWALFISLSITVIAYFMIRKIIALSVIQPLEESFKRAKSFEDIIDNSLNEVYIFNKDDLHFTYVNRGAVLNTGYTLEEMRAMTPLEIKPEFSKDHFLRLVMPLLHGEREQIAFETVHERKDGSRYDADIRVQLMPIKGEERFVAFINDITERNRALQAKEHYYELSTHDHLTKIYNRQKFDELYAQELERVRRYGGKLTIILFDIDHFKMINDTYGHQTGDDVLIALTRYIQHELRTTDVFARWGGEEFVILMPNSNYETAMHKAEQLRIGIKRLQFSDVGSITCSFGVAAVDPSLDSDDALEKVDEALYQAKQAGRNRVCGSDDAKTL